MNDELDLFILDPSERGDSPRLCLLARHGRHLAMETLRSDSVAELAAFRNRIAQAILRGGEDLRPSQEALIDYGHQLFDFLFPPASKARQVYHQLSSGHVRMHVYSNRPDVQTLPWEYLQAPDQAGPRLDRSLIRLVPTVGGDGHQPLALTRPLRMLFVSADPIDQGPVLWEELSEQIQTTFKAQIETAIQSRFPSAESRPTFVFDTIEGANHVKLRQQLRDNPYDILHFSGHGQVDDKGVGSLVLLNRQTGKTQLMPALQLTTLLAGRGFQLVVLSACNTSSGNTAKEFSVVAQTLVERGGIPAVVAAQLPLPNQTVAPFVGSLYAKLLQCGDIDMAMSEGRVWLFSDLDFPSGASLEWGIPTLHRHVGASKLFVPWGE